MSLDDYDGPGEGHDGTFPFEDEAATMDPLNIPFSPYDAGTVPSGPEDWLPEGWDMYTPKPYEFTSLDPEGFLIEGRGRLYGIEGDQIPVGMWDPNDLKGLTVKINGERVKVKGVETYAIWRDERKPYTLSFGLLVAES